MYRSNTRRMSSQHQSDFGRMCRALRVQKGLKQREVAVAMGIKLSTYGNVESSRWKVVNRARAARLRAFYRRPPRPVGHNWVSAVRCRRTPRSERKDGQKQTLIEARHGAMTASSYRSSS